MASIDIVSVRACGLTFLLKHEEINIKKQKKQKKQELTTYNSRSLERGICVAEPHIKNRKSVRHLGSRTSFLITDT